MPKTYLTVLFAEYEYEEPADDVDYVEEPPGPLVMSNLSQ